MSYELTLSLGRSLGSTRSYTILGLLGPAKLLAAAACPALTPGPPAEEVLPVAADPVVVHRCGVPLGGIPLAASGYSLTFSIRGPLALPENVSISGCVLGKGVAPGRVVIALAWRDRRGGL